MVVFWHIYIYIYRADSRFALSQWETSLQSNAVSLAGRKPRMSPAYIIYKYIYIHMCVCEHNCLILSIYEKWVFNNIIACITCHHTCLLVNHAATNALASVTPNHGSIQEKNNPISWYSGVIYHASSITLVLIDMISDHKIFNTLNAFPRKKWQVHISQ